jgi:dienelactone hydrolase
LDRRFFLERTSAMPEQSVHYVCEERPFPGLLTVAEPRSDAARPGVLVLHGGAGIGPHERARAVRLAELGYAVFVPDLFGEVFSSREQGIATITALVGDPPRLRSRLGAALAFLGASPGVDPARLAALGFCFGGHAALELARSGASIRAAASIHGGLKSPAPAAPGEIGASILVCAGAADPFVPREQRQAFEDEMTAARADWQLHLYAGAMHGFSERPPAGARPRPGVAYDEAADRRSWGALLQLLRETLGPPAAAG